MSKYAFVKIVVPSMNLEELLKHPWSPVIRPPSDDLKLESYLDKGRRHPARQCRPLKFRGYVFALLFYKRISDCFDEEVRTQVASLTKAGVPQDQALCWHAIPRITTSSCVPKAPPGPPWLVPPRPSSARR